MIEGIGTDVIHINRIEKILEKYSDSFIKKNFHPKEQEIFNSLASDAGVFFLAKRFAGKEAVSKALGCGIGEFLAFQDIAILNDDKGKPYVEIYSSNIPNLSNKKIDISLSDDYPIAVAFVVISSYSD